MIAETLQKAAEAIRADAWVEGGEPFLLAVAAWLDDTYPLMACDNCTSSDARCEMARENGAIKCCPDCAHAKRALRVARAYLGGAS